MSTIVRDDLVLSHAIVTADVETSFHDVERGQTSAEAAEARQEASGRHCEVETPRYAQSISHWAAAHSNVSA